MELSQLTTEIARLLTQGGMISDDVNEIGPTETQIVRMLFDMARHSLKMIQSPEHREKLFETAAIFQARFNKKYFAEKGEEAVKKLPKINKESHQWAVCAAWAKIYELIHVTPTQVDDDQEREHPIGTARQKKTAKMQTSPSLKRERENPEEPETAMALVELDLVEDEDKPKEIWKKKAHTQ